MNETIFEATKTFVKESFKRRPHFSFGDYRVMYLHSVSTFDISLQITEHVSCDRVVAGVGALLHDIGKTHLEKTSILHTEHESFNLMMCNDFLNTLPISSSQIKLLREVVSYTSSSDELKIIKDADALSLYRDKRLYMHYIEWASENNLWEYIQRKIDKYDNLYFDVSKSIGKEWFDNMMRDWKPYLVKRE